MKMINGQLPTWYVIKRISENPKLYAKAPPSYGNYEARAKFNCDDVELGYTKDGESWLPWKNCVTTRNDWTLYRRGKKKQKATGGEVKLGQVSYSSLGDYQYGFSDVTRALSELVGNYDIIAVPVKS